MISIVGIIKFIVVDDMVVYVADVRPLDLVDDILIEPSTELIKNETE